MSQRFRERNDNVELTKRRIENTFGGRLTTEFPDPYNALGWTARVGEAWEIVFYPRVQSTHKKLKNQIRLWKMTF